MESQGGLGQQQVERARRETQRERKRDGGSGGLIVGIATVVVVGVAGKLFQRFNSLNRAKNASEMDSMDETVASEGQRQSNGAVLKKVLSILGDHQTHDRGSNAPSIEAASDVEKKSMAYKERRSSMLLSGDPEIFDQDSLSEGSDCKCAEILLKHPLDKVPPADHEGEPESPVLETVLATNTTPGELVDPSMKHEVPSDVINTLSKTKDLEDGIAEVISRAFEDFGRREDLSGQEQAPPKKLTVQLVWDYKQELDEADTAKFADSLPGSETPVHCDAKDNSEGFTNTRDLGNVVSVFVDTPDTDLPAPADDIKPEFANGETQIEVTRIKSEVSGSEVTDWPPPITFQEFISSVQASTSTEIEDRVTEGVSVLAGSVAEEQRNSFPLPHSNGDLEYSACKDPSAVHDEPENKAELSVGEYKTFYDESHQEAESILTECEAGPSSQSQEAISRENEVDEVSTQSQQDEKESESLEIWKAAVQEQFEESLSSLELETKMISSANVDDNDAETEVDTATVHSEEEGKNTTPTSAAEGDMFVQSTDGSSGFPPIKEVGAGEITLENAEVAVGKNGEKAKSSVVLPSKSCHPGNSFKHSRLHNVADSSSANITKSAIMTTMEYPSLANKYGIFKHLETSRDRSASEVLRMAVLIALIAAIIFMIREHHLKPLKHTA